MARKEILVAGFRHVRLVGKHLKQRKAAQLSGYATGKLNSALPSKAGAQAAPTSHAKQPRAAAAQRGGRDGPVPPSFAAGSASAPSASVPAGAASGWFGGFSLKAAASALGQRAQRSPSFAAAPLWGKGSRAAAPAQSAAAQGKEAAASAPRAVKGLPAALARNPVYRLAKLGGASQAVAPPAPAPDVEKAALSRYAALGEQQAAAKAGPVSQTAARKMAALLKYAKLPK